MDASCISGVCWAPPARRLGFHRHGTGRRGSVGVWLSHSAPPAPGKAVCLSSTAESSSAGLDVRSSFACGGKEGERDLTQSSEVVVIPCKPFTGQCPHGAARILGRSSRRQGSCLPDEGTVSKRTSASCSRHHKQDTLFGGLRQPGHGVQRHGPQQAWLVVPEHP